MAITIAVANQKGGVGKTTSCVNLTAALKKRGRRVLLVDCDPQGNSTSGMGVDKQTRPNCYDMMINGAAAADCVRQTKWGDVLPANVNLSGCSVELVQLPKREQIGQRADPGAVRILRARGDRGSCAHDSDVQSRHQPEA